MQNNSIHVSRIVKITLNYSRLLLLQTCFATLPGACCLEGPANRALRAGLAQLKVERQWWRSRPERWPWERGRFPPNFFGLFELYLCSVRCPSLKFIALWLLLGICPCTHHPNEDIGHSFIPESSLLSSQGITLLPHHNPGDPEATNILTSSTTD